MLPVGTVMALDVRNKLEAPLAQSASELLDLKAFGHAFSNIDLSMGFAHTGIQITDDNFSLIDLMAIPKSNNIQ